MEVAESCPTDGVGRREKIVFRYIRLDPEERAIDPQTSLLLSAENEWTRDSGFYRDRIGGGLPEKVIMEAKNFSRARSRPAKLTGFLSQLRASNSFLTCSLRT